MAFENWYEPYKRLVGYVTLPNADELLRKVLYYLIDMPTPTHQPFTDNRCPRTRISKYLYNDAQRPLDQPIPTVQQKLSLFFDPEKPADAPSDKGYRIFPQIAITEAQENAQTRLYAFMGFVDATNDFQSDISLCFRILCNTSYDTNTKDSAMSRSWAIAQAIVEALSGVNIDGVGTFYFNRKKNAECAIRYITDDQHNVGYQLVMGLTIMGDKRDNTPDTDVMYDTVVVPF